VRKLSVCPARQRNDAGKKGAGTGEREVHQRRTSTLWDSGEQNWEIQDGGKAEAVPLGAMEKDRSNSKKGLRDHRGEGIP